MHGYVFQYGNDNVDIGYKGSKLETDAYSFAYIIPNLEIITFLPIH